MHCRKVSQAVAGRAAAAAAAATVATAPPLSSGPRPPPPLPPPQPPLAHASFGSACPKAPLVFFNHGWPGSRLGAAMLHRAALRLGVRVVGVDRPGFGGTPFCASHGFESWAHRLAALADSLGARRYAVLGVSGGGPFALAAARHAPDPARVAGLALLCPVAPQPARARVGIGCFGGGGGCGGGGGGVDAEEGTEATATPTASSSWALRAAERHPRTARVVLLVARALLASSSASLTVGAGGPSQTQQEEDEDEQQQQNVPWPARLLQRAAMGGREAQAGGEAPPAAAADIWHAVAEGLRGGGRGMLHEIGLVSRAGSLSSSSLVSLASPSSPPSSPLAPPSSPGVDGGTGGGDVGRDLFLGAGGGGGGGSSGDLATAGSLSSSSLPAPAPPPPFVAFCWHGTEDRVAPAPLAERYYGGYCEFRTFEGETHTSLVLGKLGEALAELVRRGGGEKGQGGGGGGGGDDDEGRRRS